MRTGGRPTTAKSCMPRAVDIEIVVIYLLLSGYMSCPRYCTSLSRDCTHLVVALESNPSSSRKLGLALRNRDRWQTHIVSPAWVPACAAARARLLEADFSVLQPTAPQPRASKPALAVVCHCLHFCN